MTLSEPVRKYVVHEGQISMDDKGRLINNRIIKQLWQLPKNEFVYLNAFKRVSEENKHTQMAHILQYRAAPLDTKHHYIQCVLYKKINQ